MFELYCVYEQLDEFGEWTFKELECDAGHVELIQDKHVKNNFIVDLFACSLSHSEHKHNNVKTKLKNRK